MTESNRSSNGAALIAAERQRQIDGEGWSSEHDDGHGNHELARAAACYAAPDRIYMGLVNFRTVQVEDAWPWNSEEWKGSEHTRAWFPEPLAEVLKREPLLREERIRELVKAGALIAAEIDRLQRLA